MAKISQLDREESEKLRNTTIRFWWCFMGCFDGALSVRIPMCMERETYLNLSLIIQSLIDFPSQSVFSRFSLHCNKLSLRVFNCRWAGIRDRYWSRRGRDVNSTVDPVRINWNQLMQRTFIVFMLALCVPYFFSHQQQSHTNVINIIPSRFFFFASFWCVRFSAIVVENCWLPGRESLL